MFYCPRCRGIIKSEDKFCPSCGEKVNLEVFQQKLDDDNISEVTPGNEESSIVNSQSQSGKEDPQQSEDRFVKAKIIDENSEKKVIIDNLKFPFRKNRKIIFSLITLIAIVMVAVSFFGDDKSASIYGSYKGNFEDDINTPVYIKYDGEKAYLSLAGDYFAVYDKISEDLIEGANSKDLYNIKLKYNATETRNLENGYSNINVGYVQLTGSYSQDSCMITISDVIPIGSDDTFAFGSVFKVSDSEFPEIIEKNNLVVSAESTRKATSESESIVKEIPEITSLSSEVIFCENVDSDLIPTNIATTFSAGQFYVKLQTPSAFDTREINVTIYSKSGSSESIVVSSDKQVNQDWDQLALPITLTNPGEYKVTFSRLSDSVILGEGEVTIKQ